VMAEGKAQQSAKRLTDLAVFGQAQFQEFF
jgi:hypothetical protein